MPILKLENMNMPTAT